MVCKIVLMYPKPFTFCLQAEERHCCTRRGNVPTVKGVTCIHATFQHLHASGLHRCEMLWYVGTGGLKGGLTSLVELDLLRYLFLKKGWVWVFLLYE